MRNRTLRADARWAITGLLVFGLGGCTTGDNSSDLSQISGDFNSGETNFVQELLDGKHMEEGKRQVIPIFDCVDKVDATHWLAHFGYNNTSKKSEKIPVGWNNFFFPDPENRSQPTTFLPGVHDDSLKVKFDGRLLIWILDGRFTVAHRLLKQCKPQPVDAGVDLPKDVAVDVAKDVAVDVPKEAAVDVPKEVAPEVTPEVAPEVRPEVTPEVAPEVPPSTMCSDAGVPKPNGTPCDDGLKCTTGDVCTSGVCGGAAMACPAAGVCHTQGVCQESTGTCTNPVAANGTACSDGNACTQTDTCVAGACQGANPVQCSGASACTQAGTCNTQTGLCVGGAPKADGTSCDDGLKCTTGDVCTGGTCGGAPVVCAAPTACHTLGVCSETTGACTNPVAANGSICNDGNACTQTDTCVAGACQGANPVQCSGASSCTQAGSCDTGSGLCVGGAPKPNGTLCDDGLKCTTGDVCTGGTCGGAAITCPAPADACHARGVCSETTGACTTPNAADGTTCSDGNACTRTDTCMGGVCMGNNPVQCSGATACTLGGVCNTTTGVCDNGANKPNGTVCDDGVKCSTGDVCTNGTCGGTAITCPPATDVCHAAGVCSEATGTCAPPAPLTGVPCNDGKSCTTGDMCTAGVCGGMVKMCPAGTSCDEADGMCKGGDTCTPCEQEAINNGLCEADIGCDNLTDVGPTGDKTLCLAAQACIISNHCAVGAGDVFLTCFCGTAEGATCLTAPNGPCVSAYVSASKAATPTDAATRVFDLMFPLGHATQKIQCDKDFCQGPPPVCPL